ncbi:MAG TPA: hypothetical protein VG325_04820 [Solirubrobacteraceae bacterium]|nr:hypothetical protein [Solirubrobacteraceae bacterium]
MRSVPLMPQVALELTRLRAREVSEPRAVVSIWDGENPMPAAPGISSARAFARATHETSPEGMKKLA